MRVVSPFFPYFPDIIGESVIMKILQFKCCGALRFEDWLVSEWHKDEKVLKNGSVVPDSCCKTPTFLCGKRDHPSNIQYTVGSAVSSLSSSFRLPDYQTPILTRTALLNLLVDLNGKLAIFGIGATSSTLSRTYRVHSSTLWHLTLETNESDRAPSICSNERDDSCVPANQTDKSAYSLIAPGLYLQIPGDDEGPFDNPGRRRPRPVGPRAIRHRSWLLPLREAQARLR